MEERLDVMTDNQYYGVLKTVWVLAYQLNVDKKFMTALEALMRKQDVEELREKMKECQ